jgi:hypothetical protein
MVKCGDWDWLVDQFLKFGSTSHGCEMGGLEAELADSLKRASAIAAQLQALDQGRGTPHFDQIEIPAHEVGQRLSRMIQSTRAHEKSRPRVCNR